MTTGVVVGGFLPPHRGHHHLIDTARAAVDHLDVIVCAAPGQRWNGATRAAWLAEVHPDVTVHVTPDDLPDGLGDTTSRLWAARTIEVLGRVPDLIFTSETYGDAYARFLGARHVCVDPDRSTFPVSGTAVRADPARHWPMLEPCVRAALVRRVAVVGAESTGTTTLACALADALATTWVPEHGRAWCEARLIPGVPYHWRSRDFVEIATGQLADEDAAARCSGPVLVCDTDALATAIWHERYLGHRSPEVEALAAGRRYALSVLTADDIPFVQDGTRDGEHARAWMTGRFRTELARRPDPWLEVAGHHWRRLELALAQIRSLV